MTERQHLEQQLVTEYEAGRPISAILDLLIIIHDRERLNRLRKESEQLANREEQVQTDDPPTM